MNAERETCWKSGATRESQRCCNAQLTMRWKHSERGFHTRRAPCRTLDPPVILGPGAPDAHRSAYRFGAGVGSFRRRRASFGRPRRSALAGSRVERTGVPGDGSFLVRSGLLPRRNRASSGLKRPGKNRGRGAKEPGYGAVESVTSWSASCPPASLTTSTTRAPAGGWLPPSRT